MEEKQKDLVHIHEALDFWFGPSWIWTSVDILPTNLQSPLTTRASTQEEFILGFLLIYD